MSADGSTKIRRRCLWACLAGLLSSSAYADTAIWNGGDGAWSTAGGWSGGVVPNNVVGGPTFDVKIDGDNAGASSVVLDSSPAIDTLSVDANDALTIGDARTLTIAGAGTTIDGALRITPRFTTAKLVFDGSSPQTVGGSGSILFTPPFLFIPSGAEIDNLGNNPVTLGSGISIGDTLVTINGSRISGRFNSAATISISGAPSPPLTHSLVIDGTVAGGFVNAGSISVSNGAFLSVYNFDNTAGTITVNNGGLTIGNTTTAKIGTINRTGGTVTVSGTIDNTGNTLALSAATGSWDMNSGAIVGGTISTSGGAALAAGGFSSISGVTIPAGSTVSVINGSRLYVSDNLTLNGTLRIDSIGNGTQLNVFAPFGQTISGTGTILMNGDTPEHGPLASIYNQTGSDMVLGSGLTIEAVNGGSIGGNFQTAATINVNGAGKTLNIEGYFAGWFNNSGNINVSNGATLNIQHFTNTAGGAINVNNATLNFGGATTADIAGRINRSGASSAINITGVVDNTDATIALNATTGSWGMQESGMIVGGTIATADATELRVGYTGSLLGVNLPAGSTVSVGNGGLLGIHNGLTLNGTIRLDAAGGDTFLWFDGEAQSVTGAGTIKLNASTPAAAEHAFIYNNSGNVVDLPASVFIDAPNGGQIIGVFHSATNLGISGAGKTMIIDGTGIGAFVNTAPISVSGGATMKLFNFDNTAGLVTETNATLNLGGMTTAGIGTINRTGGAINITGMLDNTAATFTLNSTTGSWGLLDGGKISGGTITTTGAFELQAGPNAALDGVTISTGSTVAVADGGAIAVTRGLTVNGAVRLDGPSAQVIFIDDGEDPPGNQIVTGSGAITGSGSLLKQGSAAVTLSNANTYTGPTTVNEGTLTIAAGGSIASSSLTVAAGATLNVLGSVPVAATVNVAGAANFGGNTGTTVLTRNLAALDIADGGLATVTPSVFPATPVVLHPASISFAAPTATLDLGNNELITSASLADIRADLRRGQIFTSSAGGTLGYLDLGGGQIEVRFTLAGDADLDGHVGVGDLGALATFYGVTNSSAIWSHGDFNESGSVDVGDLGALATNYGASLAAGADNAQAAFAAVALASAAPTTSVPEPLSLSGSAAIAMAALFIRRRRRDGL